MAVTRAPPPSGRPPSYGMVSRVYRSSLRPVVITIAIFTAIWTLIWAIDLFDDIGLDKAHGSPKLATFSIILGSMYISVCAIELFGILAASTQRVTLARIYSWLTVAGSLIVITAGFMRVVTHFVFKNDLINECASVVTGTDIVFRFGVWGTPVHDILDASEAQDFCQRAWSHDSVSEIVSLIVEIVLAGFFVTIAFSYYKQLLDPSATRYKAPSNNHQAQASASFPAHYNPPYLSYDAPSGGFAPPPGPPPASIPQPEPYGYGIGDDTKSLSSLPPYDYDRDGMILGRDVKDDKDKPNDPFGDHDSTSGHGHRESRDTLV